MVRNFLSNHTVEYSKIALGRNDLDPAHINMPTFVVGQLHFLIHAILNNRLVNRDELLTRLFQFKNSMEIVCNNSTQSEFNSRAWQLARAYDDKCIRDIELGLLSWQTIGTRLQYDCHLHALAQVPIPSSKFVGNGGPPQPPSNGQNRQLCSDYNHTVSDGNHCKWSLANPGKKCNRQHSCLFCFNKYNNFRPHREVECEQRQKMANNEKNPPNGPSNNPFLGGAGHNAGQ